MEMQIVGPILFENRDGGLIASATYTRHYRLRQPELLFQGLYYAQNRIDGGVWVYRQTGSGVAGSMTTDPFLTDIAPAAEPPPPPEPPSELEILKQRLAALEQAHVELAVHVMNPLLPAVTSDLVMAPETEPQIEMVTEPVVELVEVAAMDPVIADAPAAPELVVVPVPDMAPVIEESAVLLSPVLAAVKPKPKMKPKVKLKPTTKKKHG